MTDDLVWIPGQTAVLGLRPPLPRGGTARPVSVDGFWMMATAVTNTQFAEFVAATGYLTVAERPLDPADYPDAPPENLQPGSMVFTRTQRPGGPSPPQPVVDVDAGGVVAPPRGPRSSIDKRADHPVVHVAYEDAEAYAAWAGCRFRPRPNGRSRPAAASTTPTTPGATSRNHRANRWPTTGTASSRSCPRPVTDAPRRSAAIPPNGYGLFDMAGNVWEWTTDWYGDTRDDQPCCAADSYDPRQPQFQVPRKVVKGGSFLCADIYCLRYRPAARRPQPVDTGMSHIGFRCVKR